VVSKKVEPLYKAEGKAVAEAIRGKKPEELEAVAKEAIIKLAPEWEKVLTAVSAALIEDFGNEIADDLGAKATKWEFDPLSAAARAWIAKNGAASVKTIQATNLLDVRRVILLGREEGLPPVRIGTRLRDFYVDRSRWKAMRVARTEVVKASSFGSLEAAKQSQIVRKKTWLTSRDEDVRDEHEGMDGETVGLTHVFSNGENFPGEPNCRCVMTFVR